VTAPTDEQLLREYVEGNAAGFELLVRRHTQELFQFVLRFTRNSVTADDIVQEAFLQVHSAAASFDPARRFKPWLFTIAANKARDFLRSRNRKREVPLDAPIGQDDSPEKRFIHLMSDPTAEPERDLATEEKRRVVRKIVDELPEKLSEALILAYYHRFPYKEIAEILEIPLGTVKSRLHAAIAIFGERYTAAVRDRQDHNVEP
jgi:RNA polymerase sigma-70 factor (ECF subfamily)